jgi:hypothetical protein
MPMTFHPVEPGKETPCRFTVRRRYQAHANFYDIKPVVHPSGHIHVAVEIPKGCLPTRRQIEAMAKTPKSDSVAAWSG